MTTRPGRQQTVAEAADRWIAAACAACGETAADVLFRLDRPDGSGEAAIVGCRACGLRRLDPRPADHVLSELYADDYYAYAGRRRSPLKQRVWDAVRDASSGVRRVPPGLRGAVRRAAAWQFDVNVDLGGGRRPMVVDVGCGYGDLLVYLQSRGCPVLGIELDERAARAGQALGVPIEARPLADVGLPEGSVDVVILQHSLEHLPDVDGTIAEIARVLAPGGQLHVAVPNGASAGLRHERRYWGALFFPEHFWYFDLDALTRILERHGLAVRDARSRTIAVNHWGLLRHMLRHEPRSRERGAVIGSVVRTAATTWRPLRGDVLRVVAVREPRPAGPVTVRAPS